VARQCSFGYCAMNAKLQGQLKSLHSPDIDLQKFKPANPEKFSILVQAMIGYVGGNAAESFEFVVCTPEWLRCECKKRGPLFGAQLFILDKYSYEIMEKAISDLCSSMSGKDWNELATKIGTYAAWEFSDYVAFQG